MSTLSSNQTAALLDIKPQTLRKWRSAGIGPRFHRPGGTSRAWVRYTRADVREWLTAKKPSGPSARSWR